jgi:hypothetical protein
MSSIPRKKIPLHALDSVSQRNKLPIQMHLQPTALQPAMVLHPQPAPNHLVLLLSVPVSVLQQLLK